MGEAKRKREATGVTDERSDLDRKHAVQDELYRIERMRNDTALDKRRFGVIPHECRPKPSRPIAKKGDGKPIVEDRSNDALPALLIPPESTELPAPPPPPPVPSGGHRPGMVPSSRHPRGLRMFALMAVLTAGMIGGSGGTGEDGPC